MATTVNGTEIADLEMRMAAFHRAYDLRPNVNLSVFRREKSQFMNCDVLEIRPDASIERVEAVHSKPYGHLVSQKPGELVIRIDSTCYWLHLMPKAL